MTKAMASSARLRPVVPQDLPSVDLPCHTPGSPSKAVPETATDLNGGGWMACCRVRYRHVLSKWLSSGSTCMFEEKHRVIVCATVGAIETRSFVLHPDRAAVA